MKKTLILLIMSFIFAIIFKHTNAQWLYDSVSFEIPTSKILIDTSGGNLWQIGKPGKIFFNNAHLGTKAIITDTLNNYPPNNTSSFIYVIRNPYTQTCYTSMEFWHKYDMDSLNDIGIIDASYDGGNSWVMVSDSNNILPEGSAFWWDYDYHALNGNNTVHEIYTTGKSDGWIKSKFNWQWWFSVKSDTIILMPDSLMIRFTFFSDSVSNNKEGWIIDDILTSSAEYQSCSYIKEEYKSEMVSLYPNPFSIKTTLQTKRFLKNAMITVYNNFGQVVIQIKSISGQTVTLFSNDLPPGIYFLYLTENNKTITTKKIIINK